MVETAILEQEVGQPQLATTEEEKSAPRGSFLDPDVIFFLGVAVVIDILDVTLALGVIANILLGLPILGWMVWKTGNMWAAKEQIDRVRKAPQLRQQFRQEQYTRLAARRAATRRAWRRALLYFLGGLVPILSIFVLWTWAVISTVRGK